MTNIADSPPVLITTYGKIDNVDKFKYLSEIIQMSLNGLNTDQTKQE